MIESLQTFIAALRAAGVPVSPAEAIDAARALAVVDVGHRDDVRLALRATLAKTRAGADRFERLFAAFFAAPKGATGRRRKRSAARGAGGGGRRTDPSDPHAGPQAGTGSSRKPSLIDAEPRRARPGRLTILAGQHPVFRTASERQAASSAPRPRRAAPGRASAAGRAARPQSAQPASPRRLPLAARLTRDQEEMLEREVPRLIREIRLKSSRRWRRARAGRPWIARVMRTNVGTGGVPFLIPLRRRRQRRPRIVLMVDVSWSVLRASSLFLRMALGFVQDAGRARVFLFVDRAAEATEQLAAWLRQPDGELSDVIRRIPDLDLMSASDYGRAFYQAAHARHALRAAARRDAILVVLGDARGNWSDPQAFAFEQLAQACRRVIWLSPEPAARWDTGDSDLSEYLPWCDVVCEAGDLEGLSRGIEELVRSL